jgi:transposase
MTLELLILEFSQRQYMKGIVEQRNDIYLDELQNVIRSMTGKDPSIPTVWRALHSMGISNKRVSLTHFAETTESIFKYQFAHHSLRRVLQNKMI